MTESEAVFHIYAPKGYYIGQIRLYGHRRWQTVTGKCTRETTAMVGAVRAMTTAYKRARVLFCADWHEPVVVMACAR